MKRNKTVYVRTAPGKAPCPVQDRPRERYASQEKPGVPPEIYPIGKWSRALWNTWTKKRWRSGEIEIHGLPSYAEHQKALEKDRDKARLDWAKAKEKMYAGRLVPPSAPFDSAQGSGKSEGGDKPGKKEKE